MGTKDIRAINHLFAHCQLETSHGWPAGELWQRLASAPTRDDIYHRAWRREQLERLEQTGQIRAFGQQYGQFFITPLAKV